MKNGEKGFTLLEMLIVIGIIAVIITITAVSYSTAQKKSRDSRRKTDLKQVQSAMEQYYSICGYQYPLSTTGTDGGAVPTIGCANPATILMPTAAADPKTNVSYTMSTSNTSAYRICTTLESDATSFCISNQQ